MPSSSGVPDVSVELYGDIVRYADQTPPAVQSFAVHFTEWSILLLGVLLVVAAGRVLLRSAGDRVLALVAPLAVAIAYGCSETLKSLVDEERPCRTHPMPIVAAHCPPVGDWSFPSNHATIAGATASVVLLLSRQLGVLAVVVALLAAFSRTFVGVHYPHDVLVGLLLGSVVGLTCALGGTRIITRRLGRRRLSPAAHSTVR